MMNAAQTDPQTVLLAAWRAGLAGVNPSALADRAGVSYPSARAWLSGQAGKLVDRACRAALALPPAEDEPRQEGKPARRRLVYLPAVPQ